jgi:hypothetical protein
MTAFLTGSQVYGKPNDDSDIDLVIRLSYYEMDKLKHFAECHDVTDCSQGGPETASMIFGKLNLIVCCTDDSFAVWKVGTKRCENIRVEKRRPVLRDKAIQIFRQLREYFLGEKFSEEDA